MAWVNISDDDLITYKVAALVSALRTAALGAGQGDPVETLKAQVVDVVRRKVAACRTNQVESTPGTVPASLLPIACRMILRAAKDRLEIALTDDERKQWDKDDRELDAVASCAMPIDDAASPVAPSVQQTQPSPSIKARPRRFGLAQQDGL